MFPNNQLLQMLQRLKANPMQALGGRFSLPQGMNMSDPQAIINQLLSSGQVSQEQINRAYQQLQQMGVRR